MEEGVDPDKTTRLSRSTFGFLPLVSLNSQQAQLVDKFKSTVVDSLLPKKPNAIKAPKALYVLRDNAWVSVKENDFKRDYLYVSYSREHYKDDDSGRKKIMK